VIGANMLKKLAFPAILSSLILFKSLIIQPNLADSLMFLGGLACMGFIFYIETKREPKINETVLAEVTALRKDISDCNAYLNSQKMAQSVRLR
jgi:hypothetical protein